MSAISSREKNMLIVVGVLMLCAFSALCYKKQVEDWRLARKAYRIAQRKFDAEKALIKARPEWDARYEKMRSLMPVFPYERDVDTHWLNVMDTVAQRNNLTITRRQASKELEVGDVFELPVECKDWEGTLESLVKFLYDLSQQGAMLDIRNLYVRPSARPGFLKGSFTLYCAYMRGDEERAAVQTASRPPEGETGTEPEAEKGTEPEGEKGKQPAPDKSPGGETETSSGKLTPEGNTRPSPAPLPAGEGKGKNQPQVEKDRADAK